jgi:hypothetical protein
LKNINIEKDKREGLWDWTWLIGLKTKGERESMGTSPTLIGVQLWEFFSHGSKIFPKYARWIFSSNFSHEKFQEP